MESALEHPPNCVLTLDDPRNRYIYTIFIGNDIIYSKGVLNSVSSNEGALQKIIEKHWVHTSMTRYTCVGVS